MRKTTLISLLALFMLACAFSAPLPTGYKSAEMSSEIRLPTEPPRKFVVCRSGGLRLRSAAGTANRELAILQDGETVLRTASDPEYPVVIAWYEVTTSSGLTGWASGKYLCPK